MGNQLSIGSLISFTKDLFYRVLNNIVKVSPTVSLPLCLHLPVLVFVLFAVFVFATVFVFASVVGSFVPVCESVRGGIAATKPSALRERHLELKVGAAGHLKVGTWSRILSID